MFALVFKCLFGNNLNNTLQQEQKILYQKTEKSILEKEEQIKILEKKITDIKNNRLLDKTKKINLIKPLLMNKKNKESEIQFLNNLFESLNNAISKEQLNLLTLQFNKQTEKSIERIKLNFIDEQQNVITNNQEIQEINQIVNFTNETVNKENFGDEKFNEELNQYLFENENENENNNNKFSDIDLKQEFSFLHIQDSEIPQNSFKKKSVSKKEKSVIESNYNSNDKHRKKKKKSIKIYS